MHEETDLRYEQCKRDVIHNGDMVIEPISEKIKASLNSRDRIFVIKNLIRPIETQINLLEYDFPFARQFSTIVHRLNVWKVLRVTATVWYEFVSWPSMGVEPVRSIRYSTTLELKNAGAITLNNWTNFETQIFSNNYSNLNWWRRSW